MTEGAIDTADRVLTRVRLEQLRAVGLFPHTLRQRYFTHFGPLAPIDRICDENVPARADMLANDGWIAGDELGDEQNRLFLAGDPRGLYGDAMPSVREYQEVSR